MREDLNTIEVKKLAPIWTMGGKIQVGILVVSACVGLSRLSCNHHWPEIVGSVQKKKGLYSKVVISKYGLQIGY